MTEIFNKKEYKGLRRKLRNQSHDISTENILWKYLCKKQLLGYKFRRQFGIENYIVDFYCPKLKLAIEVDGATHVEEIEIKKDKKRQKFIESLGISVKRYNSYDVQKNISEVIGDIEDVCKLLGCMRD